MSIIAKQSSLGKNFHVDKTILLCYTHFAHSNLDDRLRHLGVRGKSEHRGYRSIKKRE